LYADLAGGGANIDAFANLTGLSALATSLGTDARMVRLMLAISGENIAAGVAGAAFVAYLSSIVSKQYTAVQYALLSSLTFLIGSLGRGIAGEAFDTMGYAVVFHYTAAVGGFAVLFVLLEWARTARAARLDLQSGR
jgi:PAT family beta-lactamase induction signal transducer AmpG